MGGSRSGVAGWVDQLWSFATLAPPPMPALTARYGGVIEPRVERLRSTTR
jgi:hypothetical protein